MRKVFSILFIGTLISFSAHAQNDCEYEITPKIQKLLDQSKDTKKYESKERLGFLEKALEEEPKCLPCLMRIGEMEFLLAKRSGASFSSAEKYFETLIGFCENYHSEMYYFLGAMYYADSRYSDAKKNFEKFMQFPDDDPSKFEKDYDKKYDEVKEALTSVDAYAEVFETKVDFKPIKVAGVSSTNDDNFPMISPDGEIMFFTRNGTRQAKGDLVAKMIEEFSWSKRGDINGPFDKGEALPPPFNRGTNCGGATISVDNRELIVAMKNPTPKNPENFDLFRTRYSMIMDGDKRVYQWGELENLGTNVNTEQGWESQPSLSGDGQILFFCGVRAESMKDASGNPTHDLYLCKRQPDGTWGPAQNMGPGINTSKHEKGPFMHSDSKTLYFSSNGLVGAGGMDFFHCKMNDDGSFTRPKNIGVPVNSEADEVGIVVSSDGEVAYFAARNFMNNQGWDVYQFKMPEQAKPEKVLILKGEVLQNDGNPPSNAEVEIKYTQSQESQKVAVNSDDGSYAAVVKISKKEDVTVSVKGDDVAFNSRVIARANSTIEPVVTKLNMKTDVLEENKPFVINDIFYSTNKADIEPNSTIILDEFAAYLLEHPSMTIEIRGHTDDVGNDQTNFALSADRAFEVLKYLSSKGVPGKRMTAKGFGETKPVAPNTTEEGRAMNRRTEFMIKSL